MAGKKAQEACSVIAVNPNPTDTQTPDYVNLVDLTLTNNATPATGHAAEDDFIAPVPMRFTSIAYTVDVAPGTTGGTDTRQVALAWDPPGATTVQVSTQLACTMSGAAVNCISESGKAQHVPVGSTVTLQLSSAAGASAPDAAAIAAVSLCASVANAN
jgi:hypothetical protein